MTTWGTLRRRSRVLGRLWQRARRRFGWLDHVARAGSRYASCNADRLAAALAYYAFFAVFALTGVGFAVLIGLLREDAAAAQAVQRWVDQSLPGVDVASLVAAGNRIGVIALVALLVAGLAWVKGLRSAVRAVWGFEEEPGRMAIRLGIDVAVLMALGLLLLVSVGTAVGVSVTVRWLLLDAAGVSGPWIRLLISPVGFLLGLAVNAVLAMALLSGLPRIRMPLRRLGGPALLVAAGLEVLKTVGRLYFERSMANPAYHAVAGAVGLLLFLYLLNQVVLYAAALTATSRYGTATDLAVAGLGAADDGAMKRRADAGRSAAA